MNLMSPIIALYDLKRTWVYSNDNQKNKHYFIEKRQLDSGLIVSIRSDAYYVFDFSKAPLGQPILQSEFNTKLQFVVNERVEVMHAFLACLRSIEAKLINLTFYFKTDMPFMDNYICCPSQKYNLEDLLQNEDLFSTREYKQLCEYKHHNLIISDQNIDHTAIYENTLEALDKVLKIPAWSHGKNTVHIVYVLGILYRSSVYYNLRLGIHAAAFLRTVFECLALYNSKGIGDKKQNYKKLLSDFGAIKQEEDAIEIIRERRHSGLHSLDFPVEKTIPLKIPDQHGNIHVYDFIEPSFPNAFSFIMRSFNGMFGTEIQIPIGHSIGYPIL